MSKSYRKRPRAQESEKVVDGIVCRKLLLTVGAVKMEEKTRRLEDQNIHNPLHAKKFFI